MIYQNFRFGYTYDSGTYGAGLYATDSPTTSTGAAGSTSAGGSSLLTNTGFDVAVTITIAALILLAAVLVRYWKRPKKVSASA